MENLGEKWKKEYSVLIERNAELNRLIASRLHARGLILVDADKAEVELSDGLCACVRWSVPLIRFSLGFKRGQILHEKLWDLSSSISKVDDDELLDELIKELDYEASSSIHEYANRKEK